MITGSVVVVITRTELVLTRIELVRAWTELVLTKLTHVFHDQIIWTCSSRSFGRSSTKKLLHNRRKKGTPKYSVTFLCWEKIKFENSVTSDVFGK